MPEGGKMIENRKQDSRFRMCHPSVRKTWKVEGLCVLIGHSAKTKTQIIHCRVKSLILQNPGPNQPRRLQSRKGQYLQAYYYYYFRTAECSV